ncbi:MAG: prolipoprotein diacylglyceryl transferase, partial [FCB group bacterium]|nr:prolipoprotein diacylglyceryl transferase [FCB group bacterium]
IGPLKLHTYGLFLAMAFLLSLYLIQWDSKRSGLDAQKVVDLTFWTLLAGIIGSRVLHILMFPEEYSWSDPIGWIALWNGGLVYQGGLIGGITFCYIFMRKKKMDVWRTADVVLPYLPLAHAVGRLGCFFGYGCCYGKATDSPLGVCFPRIPADISQPATGSPAYVDYFGHLGRQLWSPPVHPTQLYEFFGLLGVFFLLLYLRKHWHPYKGFVFASYLVCYGVLRFFIEIFRGDHNPTRFAGLSDQQVFSILFALAGVGLFLIMRRRPSLRTA